MAVEIATILGTCPDVMQFHCASVQSLGIAFLTWKNLEFHESLGKADLDCIADDLNFNSPGTSGRGCS